MNPSRTTIFSVSQSDKPEQIKVKLSMLVRLYITDPSPHLAQLVVTHIRAVLAYPKYIDDIEQRCQLRKLEMHWRCLASISSSYTIKGKL